MIASGLVQRASGRYFVRTLASMVKIRLTGKGLPSDQAVRHSTQDGVVLETGVARPLTKTALQKSQAH